MIFDPYTAGAALGAFAVGFGMGRFWVKESVRELRAERTELRVANVVMRERLVMEIMLSPGDPEENAKRAQKAVEAAQRIASGAPAKSHVYSLPDDQSMFKAPKMEWEDGTRRIVDRPLPDKMERTDWLGRKRPL